MDLLRAILCYSTKPGTPRLSITWLTLGLPANPAAVLPFAFGNLQFDGFRKCCADKLHNRRRPRTLHMGDDDSRLRWRWLHGVSPEVEGRIDAPPDPRSASLNWRAAFGRFFFGATREGAASDGSGCHQRCRPFRANQCDCSATAVDPFLL